MDQKIKQKTPGLLYFLKNVNLESYTMTGTAVTKCNEG